MDQSLRRMTGNSCVITITMMHMMMISVMHRVRLYALQSNMSCACMLQTIQSRTQARIYQDWSLGCATHVQAFPITAVLQQIAFRQPPPAVEHRRTVPPRPESRRSESHAKSEYTGIAPPPAFEALRSTYPA